MNKMGEINEFQVAVEQLQALSGATHLQNILKILRFDFWSDDERLFFVWMYVKMIIEKMHWDDRPYEDERIRRLLGILDE